jgi:diguanylate cyclase (GGDEF)-like protein
MSFKRLPSVQFLWVPIFLIIILIASSPAQAATQPMVQQGYLDLRNWSFPEGGSIQLRGEWEFFPGEFIFPELGNRGKTISVPALWNSFMDTSGPMGPFGYGTYRLSIDLGNNTDILGLKIPHTATSYSLYVNRVLLAQNGQVGITPNTTIPQWRPQIITFIPDTGYLELVVHMANFAHIKGGMWQPLVLGSPQRILFQRDMAVAFSLFLFGSLLSMTFYHIGLFIFRRKDRSILLFGLLCFIIAMRTILTGEVFLTTLYPQLNFEFHAAVEYLTFSLTIFVFALFIFNLYPEEVLPLLRKIIILICLGYSVFIVFFPLRFFALFLQPFQVLSILTFGYLAVILFKAIRQNKPGARFIGAGLLILLASLVNDILYANRIHTFYQLANTFPFGLFLFVVCHSFVFADKYNRALGTAETLTLELEDKVNTRTLELEEANQKLYLASIKDIATSCYNRQHLIQVIAKENSRFNPPKENLKPTYSVLYLDLDNFKYFNDTMGHLAGDLILRHFAALLQKISRSSDNIFRAGGDEFIILLPATGTQGALALAERIIEELAGRDSFRTELEEFLGRPLKLRDKQQLSCSIGIASFVSEGVFQLEQLIHLADKALLEAKRKGKNRTAIAQ